MKVVIQRVKSASVTVRNEITGAIEEGLLLLVGIHQDDTKEQLEWMCEKILKLRIFEDEEEKMNLSVSDVGGGLLVVSQFTLYGNTKKGTRPSFIEAAKPDKAEPMYEEMISYFKEHSDLSIQTGKFGAMMDVELINDGPVTLILEK
ncbi:MAG TPA: D-tyrosyl-tRNA(Tyr) deacylase [Balneola sp.]|jgi:D-aminoacyl-tRNA deacylase|nr:D-tyrosyl-tRNA(Tyr) deacylase [Balneola sp.]MAO76666.1 D-tyrosyl-tRNA(Tyr) deacylase [Balneola sp.]MBF65073.1 D-tyrosyl-tRNA(Tyr) deacylase [Balneola sp.]HBZ37628.1 D-tyrosyl-tRNA(Tyr) deacylase [Balneola sp.]|tara:strand:+ start:37313 stop:37753 length:441 start_codon:yes stop_codon:yes gene_type:complete